MIGGDEDVRNAVLALQLEFAEFSGLDRVLGHRDLDGLASSLRLNDESIVARKSREKG